MLPTAKPTAYRIVGFSLLLAGALFAGCTPAAAAATRAPSTVARAPEPPGPRHVYRLDYVVTSTDGKAPASASYVLNVEERNVAELRVGANVALGSGVRTDVGLSLRSHVEQVGEKLLLHSRFELTSADAMPTIQKMVANTDVAIALGKPVTVATLDEPTTHRRYEVVVTTSRQD